MLIVKEFSEKIDRTLSDQKYKGIKVKHNLDTHTNWTDKGWRSYLFWELNIGAGNYNSDLDSIRFFLSLDDDGKNIIFNHGRGEDDKNLSILEMEKDIEVWVLNYMREQ